MHQPYDLPRTDEKFHTSNKKKEQLVANDVHKVSEQLKKRVVTPPPLPLQQILMNSVGNGTHLGTIDPMMNNNLNNNRSPFADFGVANHSNSNSQNQTLP